VAKFRSYIHPLTVAMQHVLSHTPEPVIVEYGPGYSTIHMRRLAPGGTIVTVEDREDWLAKRRKEFAEAGLTGVTLLHRTVQDGYVRAPDQFHRPGTVDLVYVDGRKRSACLKHARSLVKPDIGIVVLHDAERPPYRLGFWLWPRRRRIRHGGFMNRTIVLAPTREVADALRDRICADQCGSLFRRPSREGD